jgi:hypothetical protein
MFNVQFSMGNEGTDPEFDVEYFEYWEIGLIEFEVCPLISH